MYSLAFVAGAICCLPPIRGTRKKTLKIWRDLCALLGLSYTRSLSIQAMYYAARVRIRTKDFFLCLSKLLMIMMVTMMVNRWWRAQLLWLLWKFFGICFPFGCRQRPQSMARMVTLVAWTVSFQLVAGFTPPCSQSHLFLLLQTWFQNCAFFLQRLHYVSTFSTGPPKDSHLNFHPPLLLSIFIYLY